MGGKIYELVSENLQKVRIAVGAMDWPTDITAAISIWGRTRSGGTCDGGNACHVWC